MSVFFSGSCFTDSILYIWNEICNCARDRAAIHISTLDCSREAQPLPLCPCSSCAKKCAARYHCRVMMWFSYYAKITIWSGHTSAGIRLTSKEYEPQTCLFFYRGQTSLLYIWSASQNTEGGWPCLFCFKRSRPVQRHCFKNKESEAPCLLFPLEPSSSKQMSGLGIRNQGTSSKCVQLCALLRAISLSI